MHSTAVPLFNLLLELEGGREEKSLGTHKEEAKERSAGGGKAGHC